MIAEGYALPLPTAHEVREIVLLALVEQFRTAKRARKRDEIKRKLLGAMRPLDHYQLPGVFLQVVQRPSVKCGGCDNTLVYSPEVEVIYEWRP